MLECDGEIGCVVVGACDECWHEHGHIRVITEARPGQGTHVLKHRWLGACASRTLKHHIVKHYLESASALFTYLGDARLDMSLLAISDLFIDTFLTLQKG